MKRSNQSKNHRPTSHGFTWLALLLSLILPLQPALAGKITLYFTDASGSPVAATDVDGNIIWREHYQPYGEKLNEPLGEDIGYTGHEFDAETGLTYMQARYYDPEVGRFLAIDPVGFKPTQPMTFNRYSYANNNPNKYVDPDGRSSKVASLLRLTAKGTKALARLSKEQAVRVRRAGGNVLADRKQVARQIETAAHGKKDLLKHRGHTLSDGAKGNPHFQSQGSSGHTFWGKAAVALTAASEVLDQVADAAEMIDPTTLLSSPTPEAPDGYDMTWFGAYEKVDPDAPPLNEAFKQEAEKSPASNNEIK